jgi:cell division protein FtsB
MSTLTAEINEAIRTHLPGFVGAQLREVLEKGERNAADLKKANEHIAKLTEENKRLATTIEQITHNMVEQAELDKREKAVTEREIRQEVSDLKVTMLKERVADLKEVTLAVFANNRYKYSERAEVPFAAPHPNGYMQVTQGTATKTSETQG